MKFILLFVICANLYAVDFRERNLTTGVQEYRHSIGQDKNRYSLLAHINSNLLKPTSLVNFELIYGRKLELCWLEFFVSKNSGRVSSYTSINQDTNANLLSGGIGVSYRSDTIGTLFSSDRVFDTASLFLAYHLFNETGNDYNGYGVKLDYGIHYRATSRFHYGVRFSYNIGSISAETETGSVSELTLSWSSFGAELGYYF